MTENRLSPQFTPDCTKTEVIVGMIWLVMHMVVLPLVLPLAMQHLFPEMTPIQGNALYYGFSFVVVIAFSMKLLRREFDHLLDRLLRCVSAIFAGYFLWYALSLLVFGLTNALGLDATTPNDQAIDQLAKESYNLTLVISVVAAPILEEVLFRGILFQSIRKRSRIMAYAASLLLFGVYHIWQFALMDQDWSYLLHIVQYLPITFALTWCYEYSGSLWTAILFHASNNYLAMSLLRLM